MPKFESTDKPLVKYKPGAKWVRKAMPFKQPNEHPKHYIAKYVIRGSFWAALGVTLLVVINCWWFRDCDNKVPDLANDIRVIWEIVTPLITLVLGYEFGKSEK